jgi:CheY-like chemotaxis protein/anti-sigma regulatory factor (Ser/Thr protein kinase)
MVRLVDDLLDVSRITHGKLVLERAPLDLVEVARSALEAAAAAFNEKGVQLLTEGLEQHMPAFGDSGRIAQVFGNLLQNAIRFTPEGKSVLLRATRHDGTARFEVIDQGRGIEPTDLHAIFQMFVQSRQGLARSEGGLGLGLTIAERIVSAHGGRIEASSAGLGRGATFTVTFPLDVRATPRADAPEASLEQLSIVVVEDQADAREALGMILQIEGHTVASAADGPTGLALILSQRPEVALLDLGLPGMNGYEIATHVREQLGSSITLIAMSGYGQPEDVKRSETAGFDRHLTKPVDPRRLANALRDIRWRETFSGPRARSEDLAGRVSLRPDPR